MKTASLGSSLLTYWCMDIKCVLCPKIDYSL